MIGATLMREAVGRWSGMIVGIVTLALGIPGPRAIADETRLADYFGFLPLEIYKLDPRINNLLLKDLDGDKIDDIIVVNNGRSRIDLLLSGKKPGGDSNGNGEGSDRPKGETNEVVGDRRMRLVSVPVNKEVVSLQAGDLNSDGKIDLAFYGTPAELVVLLNEGNGEFRQTKRINSGEAVESGNGLALGDLNRDGKADLALLEANELVLVYQDAKGQLGEPERLPHTAGNPRMLRAVDLDGDGGDDLVILDGGSDDPLRVRFAIPGGKLGPEQRFPGRVAQGDRLRKHGRQAGLRAVDSREPVGPRPGPDPRRGGQGRRGQAWPPDLLSPAPRQRARAFVGAGRP